MKIWFLLPLLFSLAVSYPIGDEGLSGFGAEMDLVGGKSTILQHHLRAAEPHKLLDTKKSTSNFVEALKIDIERNHAEFMKTYDAELKRMESLTKVKSLSEKEYNGALKELHAKYALWTTALADLRMTNTTIIHLKNTDDDYKDEKALITHLYEYVKVFQSLTKKDKYYKHNCVCNATIV